MNKPIEQIKRELREKPAMGINVKSDTKAGLRYADLIVDGRKTLESRNSDTLRPYVGKRVSIVRTGEGPAKAIGEVTIGEPTVVNKNKFRSMEPHHMVPQGSQFDISASTKHLYPMHDPVRYETERDVGHGIIARKVIHKAGGGPVLPIGPPADVAAKLAALKEQMRQQGTNFDRRMQGVVNAEKTAGTGTVLPTDKAKGGLAHMAGGGHKELEEYIRQHEGQYGLHRLQRAQDEIHNLHGMYAPEALRQAFSGDNAKALMTMNPADFEKYAMQLKGNQTTGAITPSLEDRIKGQKARKTDLSTEDYVKYLQSIGKFSDVPYLQIDKEEVGLPLTPFISGHEGRHRNRAMASQGINRGLVVLHPRTELREPLPRRSREEYINALKEELAMTGNMVKPQQDKTNPRPAIQMPDIYADGGTAHMAGGGNMNPKFPSVQEMIQKLQEAGRTPIVPAPNRWFADPVKHPFQQKMIERVLAQTGQGREGFPSGSYINPQTGEPMDFDIMHDLGVAIDPNTGRPMMSGIKSDLTEIDPRLGSVTKSNLVRRGLFKHEGGDELLKNLAFLATIEKSGKGHHYGLSTHYESPAQLVNTMTGQNPTLRPHSRGDIFGVGDEVGRISIQGKHHPVYEKLLVAPAGSNVQGKKLHKAHGGVTHAHHLDIEERPL